MQACPASIYLTSPVRVSCKLSWKSNLFTPVIFIRFLQGSLCFLLDLYFSCVNLMARMKYKEGSVTE
jgi:hypothetical protein